jgi:pyridoxine 5-phosphate synthase
MVEAAKDTGADRIELYTESYASNFVHNKEEAVRPFELAGELAYECNLGLNAGHDLNLDNLHFFSQSVPHLLEVSIGHALISDALYYGLENTIMMYRRKLG